MELGTELMDEQALQDLDRRVTTLEAEHKERWKAQFALNDDLKEAIANLVSSIHKIWIRLALASGAAAAGGAGGAHALTHFLPAT